MDLIIPATKKAYFKDSDLAHNKEVVNRIKAADYYKYITKYAEEAKIPANLLTSIIAIESGGNAAAKNKSGSIGLMQMKWGTAYDTIKKEAKDKTLTEADKIFIKNLVPSIGKGNFAIKYGDFVGLNMSQVTKELNKALENPQFNVLMGALHIGQMIDKFTTWTGQPMLHQSLAIYNQGIGRSSLVKPYTTVDGFLSNSKIAQEAKNYVLKAMGTNGYLDILTS